MDMNALDEEIRRVKKRLEALKATLPAHQGSGAHEIRILELEEELDEMQKARAALTSDDAPPIRHGGSAAMTKPTTFGVSVEWQEGRRGVIACEGKPPLPVATPPEFGGPPGVWTPEELLVASVASCLMNTFLYFADRFKVPFLSYSTAAKGRMEMTERGLRFTQIEVAIAVSVGDAEAADKIAALRFEEKLEKYCPVSAAVNCPVRLRFSVSTTPEHRRREEMR